MAQATLSNGNNLLNIVGFSNQHYNFKYPWDLSAQAFQDFLPKNEGDCYSTLLMKEKQLAKLNHS